MQAFSVQLNVCCTCRYRLLKGLAPFPLQYNATDLDLFKSFTKLGKGTQEESKGGFSIATPFRYILKAWKRQKCGMCPKAQHLGSCPHQNM